MQPTGRIASLDAFRGLTIAMMFLVNNEGDWSHVWPWLRHADWNGCTLADLVFPFFLFIMGVAMPLSFARRFEAGGRPALVAQVFRRSLILSGLNAALALLAWWAFLGHFRFYGVLQRIAFCYFLASLILLWGGARAALIWMAGLLAAYYLTLKWVPAPGHGAATLERFGNIVDYVDSRLMRSWLYELDDKSAMGHDPEGLISTAGALATTLGGVVCGIWLKRSEVAGGRNAGTLAVYGFAACVLGLLWSADMPFNKNLWTPPYAAFTLGLAMLALGALYWLMDLRGRRAWAMPLTALGMNAITAYFLVGAGSYVVVGLRLKAIFFQRFFAAWIVPLAGAEFASACWGLAYVLLGLAGAWVLYRKNIFIKV